MTLAKSTVGEVYVGGATVLWSFFPLLAVVTVKAFPPLFSLGLATFFTTVFFALVLTLRQEWKSLRHWEGWKCMLLVTLFIAVIFYGLLFWAAQHTSAAHLSILNLSEAFWAIVVISWIVGHESLSWEAVVGCLLMVGGTAIILFPGRWNPNVADLVIVLANISPTIGNIYMRRARQYFSSHQMLFIRSLLGMISFFLLSLAFGESQVWTLSPAQWGLFVLLGVVFMGWHKVLWIEAIHRIAITKTNAIQATAPIFTLLWLFWLWGETPPLYQLLGLIPLLLGAWLILLRKNIFRVLKV